MVNSGPEASGPEEMNTVQIRYVYTPGVGRASGKKLIQSSEYTPNLKPNTNIHKKLQRQILSIYTRHRQDARKLPSPTAAANA